MLQGGLILHWHKQYHPKKPAESSCGNLNNGQNHPKVTLSISPEQRPTFSASVVGLADSGAQLDV